MSHVLCVHDVVDDDPDSAWEVRLGDLELALKTLLALGYRFCRLCDIPELRDHALAVTFDDGAGGGVNWVLERAESFGLHATIFPVVSWLDHPPLRSPKYDYRSLASWRDIERAHRSGHDIGSHGVQHVPMDRLAERELVYELRESKVRLEERCGSGVDHFAAPFGKLSPTVIEHARAVGYSTISSTKPGANTEENILQRVLKRNVLRSDLPGLGLAELLGDRWSA